MNIEDKRCVPIREIRKPDFLVELHRCPLCKHFKKLTKHHIVAKREGGKDGKYNEIRVCRKCHDEIEQNELLYESIKRFN